MTTFAQVYCTLAEVDQDLNLLGSESAAAVYAKILSASSFLQKEIGWFLPVTMQRALTCDGGDTFFVPPLLTITSIVHTLGGTELTLDSADYLPGPDGGHWPNGPYSWLQLKALSPHLADWVSNPGGILVNGAWGLYARSEALGATLGADQGVSAATVQVSNGASLSPGMVILVEAEQQLVTGTDPTPASATTLSMAMDAAQESINFTNGSGLQPGEILRVGLEQMRLLDRNGNTGYVTRGWNRTTRVPHATADAVQVYRTFAVARAVNGTTAVATHASGTAVSRQMVPQDINFLAREIAGKMLKFSQSGYMGRVGDENTGQVAYNFAIPRLELTQIKMNYLIYSAG